MSAGRFLAVLAKDATLRAELVETLRASAAHLDGSTPLATETAVELAARVRAVATVLCEHARLVPGGECRYCGSVAESCEEAPS